MNTASSLVHARADRPLIDRAVLSPTVDGLRGLAAVLMIVNHVGASMLAQGAAMSDASALVFFIGSTAPVLFFFLTGFGLGLRPSDRVHPLGPTLVKAAALMLADAFLAWQRGGVWGLDFFGFIAVSMVVVAAIDRIRHASVVAVALALVLLVVRFAVAPRLGLWVNDLPVLNWVVGHPAIDNISYPLTPWLVYPLLGFVLARGLAEPALASLARWFAPLGVMFALPALATVAGLWALYEGMVVHRWGSVSAAYFALSIGVLAACGVVTVVLQRAAPAIVRGLALRGVAAFVVVPVHYALIEAMRVLGAVPHSGIGYAAAGVAAVLVSFAASKGLGRGFEARAARPWAIAQALGLAALAALAMAVAFALDAPREARFAAGVAGQLAVAMALAGAMRARQRPAA